MTPAADPAALTLDGGPVVVAINPTAGRGRGSRLGTEVLRLLRAGGVEATAVVGADLPDLERRVAHQLEGPLQALVVVGGDGMVHAGVNAVAGTAVPLGIVAAGTGNDFARLLRLPLNDAELSVTQLLGDGVNEVDCGLVGEEWFAGVCSTGFDAAVNERANRMTWAGGRVKYNLAMLVELGAFRPFPLTLTIDGQQREQRAMLVAVGNGVSYGGGMQICPGARLDDGVFHVTVLEPVSRLELLRVFPTVYSGRHVDHPKVRVYQAAEVSIAAPTVAYADGERIGDLPVRCRTVRRALRVIAPALT